jgi:polyphosphate glucokinase
LPDRGRELREVAVSGQVPIAIGVDVGGSGIKGAAVDLTTGRLASNRHRILTPQPATPQACLQVIARIIKAITREMPAAATVPIGIGVPSVVIGGVTRSAANIDAGWVGFAAEDGLERILSRPVHVVNDADAAGLAEMRFGAGRGRPGTVIVLTLGTGLGSGFFVDGRLVPNTELGHMEIRGRDAERRSAAAARVRRGLSWKAWAEDLDEHLNAMYRLFSPSLLIVGGGVSKNADKFIPRLTVPTEVVAAGLRNEAGIVGAALFAAEAAGIETDMPPVDAPEQAAEGSAEQAAEGSADAASAGDRGPGDGEAVDAAAEGEADETTAEQDGLTAEGIAAEQRPEDEADDAAGDADRAEPDADRAEPGVEATTIAIGSGGEPADRRMATVASALMSDDSLPAVDAGIAMTSDAPASLGQPSDIEGPAGDPGPD